MALLTGVVPPASAELRGSGRAAEGRAQVRQGGPSERFLLVSRDLVTCREAIWEVRCCHWDLLGDTSASPVLMTSGQSSDGRKGPLLGWGATGYPVSLQFRTDGTLLCQPWLLRHKSRVLSLGADMGTVA